MLGKTAVGAAGGNEGGFGLPPTGEVGPRAQEALGTRVTSCAREGSIGCPASRGTAGGSPRRDNDQVSKNGGAKADGRGGKRTSSRRRPVGERAARGRPRSKNQVKNNKKTKGKSDEGWVTGQEGKAPSTAFARSHAGWPRVRCA